MQFFETHDLVGRQIELCTTSNSKRLFPGKLATIRAVHLDMSGVYKFLIEDQSHVLFSELGLGDFVLR